MNNGWERRTLQELCVVKPPKSEVRLKFKRSDLVSFLPMEDLGIMLKEVSATKERILGDVIDHYTYFAENDLLLAKITPCFENGKVGVAKNLKNGIGFGSSEYFVIRSKGIVSPEYLFYFLSRQQFRNEGVKTMTGAVGHKRVSKDFIENYSIPFPKDRAEQKRIVEILNHVFDSIKKAKVNIEKNINNEKELFKSYLKNVFLNSIENWEKKNFDEVCILQRGFDLPTHSRIEGRHPLVSSNGITDKINQWKVKGPGVVTGRSGTIGNVHFIEDEFWPLNTALYIKNFHGNHEKFVYYFLKYFDLGKYSTGAGVPTLNRNNVHNEVVYFPTSIEEQKNIVKTLDLLSFKLKEMEIFYFRKIEGLEELKKAIIQKSFTGELTFSIEKIIA
jgi:type I restriction enzyme S subunit